MRTYQYPAVFTPDEDGGFVVTFPDVPEAITQGDTIEKCIEEGADALEEAFIGRMKGQESLPEPSSSRQGQYVIPLPPQTAFKAALYDAIRSRPLNKVEMAALLGIDEKEVRRLLDPRYSSKLPRVAEVLGRMGKRVVISIEDEAELATHS